MTDKTNANATENQFSEGLNERLEKYVPLSFNLARQFSASVIPFEELQQIALIGIARALESYEEGRSSEMSWVYFKGYHAVKDAIRNEVKRRRHSVQLNWESSFDVEARKTDASKRTNFLKEMTTEHLNVLRLAMRTLDARTRQIVKLVGLRGMRQTDVGRLLGISQSWTSRIYNQGLDKMRDYLLERICVNDLQAR